MNRQLLPLPVGEPAPRGSRVRPWDQHGFRARLDRAALAAGVALAAAGVWLSLQPRATTLSVDGNAYRVGSLVLPEVTPSSYLGNVAVVIRRDAGVVRASASGRLAGERMEGLCVYVDGTDTEQCLFVVGRRTFHAVDRLRGRAWSRAYDDGQTALIKLEGGGAPVPVPLPVAWRVR